MTFRDRAKDHFTGFPNREACFFVGRHGGVFRAVLVKTKKRRYNETNNAGEEEMKEFFAYFFGKGDEVEFRNFTLAHFLPILLMIAVIVLIWVFRIRLRNSKHEKKPAARTCADHASVLPCLSKVADQRPVGEKSGGVTRGGKCGACV